MKKQPPGSRRTTLFQFVYGILKNTASKIPELRGKKNDEGAIIKFYEDKMAEKLYTLLGSKYEKIRFSNGNKKTKKKKSVFRD